MMITSALILFYFLAPLAILYLCHRYKNMSKIGAFIITYLAGLVLGNIVIIPRGSDAFRNLLVDRSFIQKTDALELFQQGVIRHNDLTLNQIASIQDLIISIVIPLSIPLLLFKIDLKNLGQIFKTAFSSTVIAIISIVASVFAGFFLFRDSFSETWKISGMLVGFFSGGISNLAATSNAMGVCPNLFFVTQTFNLIIGMILFLIFTTFGKRLFYSMHPNSSGNELHSDITGNNFAYTIQQNLIEKFSLKKVLPLAGALGISILIVAISFGTSSFFAAEYHKATMILLISLLGILFGQIPKINQIEKTFDLGMYFILIFSLVVSSMVDLRALFQLRVFDLFLYISFAIVSSLILTVAISAIFRIKKATTIVTIIALFMSPAFFPFVADTLKKKGEFAMGISICVCGMVAGNFLGIFLAYLVKNL